MTRRRRCHGVAKPLPRHGKSLGRFGAAGSAVADVGGAGLGSWVLDDEGAVQVEDHHGASGVHDADPVPAECAADAELDPAELDRAAVLHDLDPHRCPRAAAAEHPRSQPPFFTTTISPSDVSPHATWEATARREWSSMSWKITHLRPPVSIYSVASSCQHTFPGSATYRWAESRLRWWANCGHGRKLRRPGSLPILPVPPRSPSIGMVATGETQKRPPPVPRASLPSQTTALCGNNLRNLVPSDAAPAPNDE
jgi:hypothetical protein